MSGKRAEVAARNVVADRQLKATVEGLLSEVGAVRVLALLAEIAHEQADWLAMTEHAAEALPFRRQAKILSNASAILLG